ncbi:hypothetical protein OPT61_g3359 [Boeremia exigua]|uniref:Uncharacterized protein n=1 Tax=Boeremia exigua TaxID=749465 RepID=A0ACC2II46_9PLEO|nr:hypothetical protein OPT61_g3359 [Boeremia exigua]
MVARAGAGPDPIPHKQLTAEKLADAIAFCLRPGTLERAKELAHRIAEEQGSEAGAQSFQQSLRPDRLRCALSPSRASVWRIKRTSIGLSAFAVCTLTNANLLDVQDLKLFRAEEHYIDEGPRDPISGGFTAFVGAVSGMAVGLADVPSETFRALRIMGQRSHPQSRASSSADLSTQAHDPSTASALPAGSGTNSVEKLHTQVQRPSGGSTTPPAPSQADLKHSSTAPEPLHRTPSNPSKRPDMMRPTGIHVTKGAGRFLKALIRGPVNISVNLTRGMHNIPKMWGDDTVRPQERVTDFKSGMRAVGREFGFGFYDGIAGLATQPWRGAQENGASGFVAGMGKGVGGFFPKLGAACLGILSHSMQGVAKEVERLFGSDVHGEIVASRAAQGYKEWVESEEAEREGVIAQWKVMQKVLKKEGKLDGSG